MQAFAVRSPENHTLEPMDVEVTPLTGDEVLVDVARAGVCHTDLHLRAGGYDLGEQGFMSMSDRGMDYPLVLGHEIAGYVAAVGPEVTDLSVGDAVIVFPWIGCGDCPACDREEENQCPNKSRALGVAKFGGYAEQVRVPNAKYCVPAGDLDLSWAATLACSGITAYAAARKTMPLEPEEPVVVLGAGGVGLTAIATLTALGHRNICALDRSEASLERARELGAVRTGVISGDTTPADVIEVVGEKPAAVIDFVNSGDTLALGFGSVRKAGTIVQVGLFGGDVRIPTALLVLQQTRIIGNYVGGLRDLREVVKLAKDGQLPRIPIAEAQFDLETLNTTLDDLEAGRTRGRVVLTRD